ncbi:MAG: phosphoadenosine phosphosulfate reductase [Bacteroidetes bacterium 4572_77]|nr:MAG: phosphoadenosine phosphosulfate reductase [Bacteroidetes bacterium 4572_77]
MTKQDIPLLRAAVAGKSPQETIAYFLQKFGDKIAFSNSMGAEDQVITHMICDIDKSATIFTLDTARVFPETYDLIQRTNQRYGINIKIYFPDATKVENMVNKKGINLFFDSIENRKECCHIRKIEPLMRAFQGLDMWICGLRRSQSVTRTEVEMVEWDENNGLLKLNPIVDWSEEEMWAYIKENKVPYNHLHDQGFPSIGCQPCTRAIEKGEDVRAGRWWWENPDTKECGLHAR